MGKGPVGGGGVVDRVGEKIRKDGGESKQNALSAPNKLWTTNLTNKNKKWSLKYFINFKSS